VTKFLLCYWLTEHFYWYLRKETEILGLIKIVLHLQEKAEDKKENEMIGAF